KRILAYSTISQIGYMFLALGVGAWSAAIFHFMIHAFFKALLFLGAGAVIMLLHHEHNIFRMGGLRKKMPVIFWTFLIGSASLAALPLITGGFYSKDQILWFSLAGEKGNIWFFLAALIGAFITAMYTFRMVFVAFFGEEKTHVSHDAGWLIKTPLIVLAILSTFAGFIELPHTLGHVELFSGLLQPVLPDISLQAELTSKEFIIQLIAAGLSIGGVYIAYYTYVNNPAFASRIKSEINVPYNFWHAGWGFDALYNAVIMRPFVFISTLSKGDVIDRLYEGLVAIANFFNRVFASTQSGIMRWYMMAIVIGTLLVVTLSLLML
ncbi:MAG TPA: proton-conducting transporter membrane subunit, partial [Chryseosolibacter sp.]|nr:proton-conducting transporter membrane subunit [Chryseosolibacter sp.]